jgi:hypothetical protein
MPPRGFLILAKDERPAESAQATADDVQQNIDLPRFEPATLHFPGDQFVNQVIELVGYGRVVHAFWEGGCAPVC